MELLLKRIYTCPMYTIGHLYVDGKYVCDTVEDADRGLDDSMSEDEIMEKKVYSRTAIPCGTYEIAMNVKSPKYSNFGRYKWAKKYNGILPRLKNVKGFEGILIHVGNEASDSSGCLLVGLNKVKGKVISSTSTFNMLMDKYLLVAKEKCEKITIKITTKYKK